MKSRFLFPHCCRISGYVLLIVAIVSYILSAIFLGAESGWISENNRAGIFNGEILSHDFLLLSFIINLLLIGFSKEKIEDEQIAQLRLDSIQWAIYVNYIILILCISFFNGMDFFVIMVYNMGTPLLFFIIRFRFKIYQLNRSVINEGGLT